MRGITSYSSNQFTFDGFQISKKVGKNSNFFVNKQSIWHLKPPIVNCETYFRIFISYSNVLNFSMKSYQKAHNDTNMWKKRTIPSVKNLHTFHFSTDLIITCSTFANSSDIFHEIFSPTFFDDKIGGKKIENTINLGRQPRKIS